MKSFIKTLMLNKGQAINKVKPNVPTTKIQKAIRDLKISTQKSKAGKAKLDQTIFESKRNEKFTFPSKTNKKSESNTEKYKRIQGENTKVLKGMLDKATEKKADGGRIGLRAGSKDYKLGLKFQGDYKGKSVPEKIKELVKTGVKQTIGTAKNISEKFKNENIKMREGPRPVRNEKLRNQTQKMGGGRIGRKFGSPNPRKTNVQKIKETFGSKKQLSAKQMKIASLAGNKKKIDGPDFKKLRGKA